MRGKAQEKVTCPRAHSSQMAGLASNPWPSDSASLSNNLLCQLAHPHPRPQPLFPRRDRLHLHLTCVRQSCLNKGTLPLAEPYPPPKKCLFRCQAAMCVCGLHFIHIHFYSNQSSQQHYERHMISFIRFAEEKSEALKAK